MKYCKREKIKNIYWESSRNTINGIEWKDYEVLELYPKAIACINELILLDKSLEPYNYYIAIKEIVKKYYNLKGVELTFLMSFFTISTRDGKIVDYKDPIKGIIIKNYNKWPYKEYCEEKRKVIFENDAIKIQGVKHHEIQEFISLAKSAIQEVESLEY